VFLSARVGTFPQARITGEFSGWAVLKPPFKLAVIPVRAHRAPAPRRRKKMAPEPRTIRIFFERQLADLRESVPSALAAAVVSDDACLSADAGVTDALSPQTTQLRGLIAAARTTAAALGLDKTRCLILDGTAGVLIVRPIQTAKPRLIVLLLADPRDVTRALNGMHRFAAEIEARLTTTSAAAPALAA
jgi:predicted regulator of Ras-like GTPase activity (Roadblock/LC7/MglB family)